MVPKVLQLLHKSSRPSLIAWYFQGISSSTLVNIQIDNSLYKILQRRCRPKKAM